MNVSRVRCGVEEHVDEALSALSAIEAKIWRREADGEGNDSAFLSLAFLQIFTTQYQTLQDHCLQVSDS